MSQSSPSGSGFARARQQFQNAFGLALDSIRAHKLRSFLTLLGVIIGVASVVMVGAAISGLGVYAEESTAKAFGSESFLVAQIAATGRLSRREYERKRCRRFPRPRVRRRRPSVCRQRAARRGHARTGLVAGRQRYNTIPLFPRQGHILAAVRARAFDRFAEVLEKAYAGPGLVPERARAKRDAYLRFALEEPATYRLMFDLSQPTEDAYPDLVRAMTSARPR